MEPKNNDYNKNLGNILRELSDIKSSLAVNTSETSNIKVNMNEVKVDIKEIKNDKVSRRELNEAIKAINDELQPLKKFVYGLISIMGIAFVGAILKVIIKP
jgi:predicted  nucleic acid-binding Zn-ribbon protein